MANIDVRGLSDRTKEVLRVRSAHVGQSAGSRPVDGSGPRC